MIVYDANGFIPENDLGIYSYNNVTAKPNADGSITIHFGGDPESDQLSAHCRRLELCHPHVRTG